MKDELYTLLSIILNTCFSLWFLYCTSEKQSEFKWKKKVKHRDDSFNHTKMSRPSQFKPSQCASHWECGTKLHQSQQTAAAYFMVPTRTNTNWEAFHHLHHLEPLPGHCTDGNTKFASVTTKPENYCSNLFCLWTYITGNYLVNCEYQEVITKIWNL